MSFDGLNMFFPNRVDTLGVLTVRVTHCLGSLAGIIEPLRMKATTGGGTQRAGDLADLSPPLETPTVLAERRRIP